MKTNKVKITEILSQSVTVAISNQDDDTRAFDITGKASIKDGEIFSVDQMRITGKNDESDSPMANASYHKQGGTSITFYGGADTTSKRQQILAEVEDFIVDIPTPQLSISADDSEESNNENAGIL